MTTISGINFKVIFFRQKGQFAALGDRFVRHLARANELSPVAAAVLNHLLNDLVANKYNPLTRRLSVDRATGKDAPWTSESPYWIEGYEEAVYWMTHFDRIESLFQRSEISEQYVNSPRQLIEEIRFHLYTPVYKDFLDHIGENYQSSFGGGKLVFLGTGCKLLYQGMLKLAESYGINPDKLFLLDLPQTQMKAWGAQIWRDRLPEMSIECREKATKLLKSQGILVDGDQTPIAVIDDQLQGRVVYLLEQILEDKRIPAKGLGMVFSLGGQSLTRGFNQVFPERAEEIHLAGSLLDWHTRTERPVEYLETEGGITIRNKAEPGQAFGRQMEKLFHEIFDQLMGKPAPIPAWAVPWINRGLYQPPGAAANAEHFARDVERTPEQVMRTFGLNDFSKWELTGEVYLVGSGSSHQHARFLFDLLRSLKRTSRLFFPSGLVAANLVKAGDTVILFSQGGMKEEAAEIAAYAKARGGRLIVFTANQTAPILAAADQKYFYLPDWELCPTKAMGATAAYAALLDLWAALSGKKVDYKPIYYQLLSELFNFDKMYQVAAGHFLFIPTDDHYTSAAEGKLKMMEALLQFAAVERPGEFIHGQHLFWRNNPLATFILMSSASDDTGFLDTLVKTYLADKPVLNWHTDLPWPQSVLLQIYRVMLLTRQLLPQTGIDLYYPPGLAESSRFHHQRNLVEPAATEPAPPTAGHYVPSIFNSSRAFAEAWDGVATGSSIDMFPRLLGDALHNGARILSIGTGTGKDLRRIAEDATARNLSGVELLAFDGSSYMLGVARRRAGEYPTVNWEFIEGDAYKIDQALPNLTGQVDGITGRYSFQFIDLTRILPEIRRLLRPGGRFVFNMAAVNYYYDFERGRFKPEFAQTNPFKAAFHDEIKLLLESELSSLSGAVLNTLVGKQMIRRQGEGWEIICAPIQQNVNLEPAAIRRALEQAGFTDIQIEPVAEEYSLRAKQQMAYLTDSLSYYWGILKEFPGRKHEFINRIFDRLATRWPSGRFIETDIFVAATRGGER